MASTTWYVDGVNGNDGNDCKTRQTACKTIGHAISLASAGDTIGVGPATYTENLTIPISLRLIGSSAPTTIIDGGGLDTVVKIVKRSAHVTLSKLTVQGGGFGSSQFATGGGISNSGTVTIDNNVIQENDGGGLLNNNGTAMISNSLIKANHSGETGGGIWNNGEMTISHSSISGNISGNSVTAKYCGDIGAHCMGGGIYNEGTLTINDSILSANSVGSSKLVGDGGGIFSADFGATSPTLTINRSTISNNVATGGGGGISAGYLTTMTINNSTISGNAGGGAAGIQTEATGMINNSTISGNRASNVGGGINNGGTLTLGNTTVSENSASSRMGGGIRNYGGTTTLQNSIIANNSQGDNCNGTILSNGYNLSGDGTCNFSGPGDLNNTDPKLGPLQNNGGPTKTQALLSGSPAIDAGNPNGCTDGNGHLLKTDQRGKPRPDKEDTGGCDMGAYERQSD